MRTLSLNLSLIYAFHALIYLLASSKVISADDGPGTAQQSRLSSGGSITIIIILIVIVVACCGACCGYKVYRRMKLKAEMKEYNDKKNAGQVEIPTSTTAYRGEIHA